MRKLYLTFLYLFLSAQAMAQIAWPAITRQTKPWARWWWQGSAVNKADLTTNLETYNNAGLGGLEITPQGIIQVKSTLPPNWHSVTITGVGPDKKTYVVK